MDERIVAEDDLRRYRRNLQGELDSAFLYRRLAELEDDGGLAEVYRRLAATEERHAELWRRKLEEAGDGAPLGVSRRARLLGWLAGRVGTGAVVPLLAAEERRDRFMYDHQPEAAGTSLPHDERSHARVLGALAGRRGLSGGAIARLEGRHSAVGGNALRAAVLGANDGLVSNLSLVMGVAGATAAGRPVLIAGLAGLLAGALSMALGEWLSVQSSRELYEEEIATEREEIAELPGEEEEELTLIYQAKGIPEAMARQLAAHIMSDPESALDTLAREELGVDPATLGGSAWAAAGASFLLFSLGALVPVLPFLATAGYPALWWSLGLSAGALFGVGAAITLVTGKSVLRSGLRQVGFGLAAAAVTYGLGALLGVTLAG